MEGGERITLEKVEKAYLALRHSFEDPAEFKHAYAQIMAVLRPPREKLTPEEARRRHEARQAEAGKN